MELHGYPKIYRLGLEEVADVLSHKVEITEKVDGSAFGFGLIDGKLVLRSKRTVLPAAVVSGMFAGATAAVNSIRDKLIPGACYWGETLEKPRHNKIQYGRIPRHHVALYGINVDGKYVAYETIKREAERLGFDVVPLLYRGRVENLEKLDSLFEDFQESFLGGMVEGIVIRPVGDPCPSAKLVKDEFKERMVKKEKSIKQDSKTEDAVREFFESFATEARWTKAIQHLKEDGIISRDTPENIGLIIKEIQRDTLEEEENFIKENLWVLYKRMFLRTLTEKFPKWYMNEVCNHGSVDNV